MLTLSLNCGVLGQVAAPLWAFLVCPVKMSQQYPHVFFQQRLKGFHQTLKRVCDPKSSKTVVPNSYPWTSRGRL